MNQQEREHLKQEYKEHYRKIREAKQRLRQSQRSSKIAEALRSMDNPELFETMDEFMFKLKDKITHVEARLEIALENLTGEESEETGDPEENEEVVRRQRARDTLKQVKAEMGMLYNEIEQQASEMHAEKTVGSKQKQQEGDDSTPPTNKQEQA